MKGFEFFKKFRLEKVKLNAKFAEAEFSFQEADKDAAWDLYVELLTSVATQPLLSEDGDEQDALQSVYEIFPTTREILRSHGRKCAQFTKIAAVVLNQILRPFTTKWHTISKGDGFKDQTNCMNFREELQQIQEHLRSYAAMLASIAEVEDLTEQVL